MRILSAENLKIALATGWQCLPAIKSNRLRCCGPENLSHSSERSLAMSQLHLESLEERSMPSGVSAVLPLLTQSLQYAATELKGDSVSFQTNYNAGVQALNAGNLTAAQHAFFNASWWHGRGEGDFCNGQEEVSQYRGIILDLALSGQIQSEDVPVAIQTWFGIQATDQQDDATWNGIETMWTAKFPGGELYLGADSLAGVSGF